MLDLFLAILPTIVIMTFILKFDRYNKEPLYLLALLFISGCLSVIPAILLEELLPKLESLTTYTGLFVYCVFGIGLIEEGVKYLTTKAIAYKNRAFDEIYDGIIYCVMVSLGFATIENIMYVSSYGLSSALLRAFTAVPAHTIFAVTMGYYLGLSKAFPSKGRAYKALALIVPMLLHGFYDFLIYAVFGWGLFLFVGYGYFMFRRALNLIRDTHHIEPFL